MDLYIARKSTNVVWHQATITREKREELNGHRGAALWFTGLPSSGKSTIAHAGGRRTSLQRSPILRGSAAAITEFRIRLRAACWDMGLAASSGSHRARAASMPHGFS